MPSYSNGNIPYNLLVTFARGYNNIDKDWDHSLSPATKARHDRLVRLARNRTGRTIAISSGWSAYRPYHAQVIARQQWGNGAATPGTSSHGGFWEGRQTLAMDYGNWAWVYEGKGGRDAFWADCRAAGLTPGMIMKSRGYPDEPWHVIDLNPWSAVPHFGDEPSTSAPAQPEPPKEDDDMLMITLGGQHKVALGPGIFRHFLGADPYEKIKNVSRIQDDWQDISFAELPAYLVTYGCDKNIWDVRNGEFVVLDPLDGSVKSGNAWTAEKAIRAQIASIPQPVIDTAPIVAAVRDAIAKTPIGDRPAIDETAIAVAVRAEFAKNPLTSK